MPESIKLLVIEDDESDFILAVRNIEKSDFLVSSRQIQTAEEMKAALDEEPWDIIVSDYSLPSFDAPSALKMLLDSGKNIPFIVISGTISEETAIGLMRLGAADYLMKDRLARLGPLVRRELNISRVRKEREESLFALQQSQNWFNLIYNATSDLMFLLLVEPGNHFRYQNANSAYLNFFGKKFDDLVGKKVEDVDDPDLVPGNLEKYAEAIKKKTPILYENRINLAGAAFILRTSLLPILDQNGKCTHLLGSSQDISDLKNAEVKLRENEERFRLIVERSNSMFYRQDYNSYQFEYVSPKAIDVIGYTPDEVMKWNLDRQKSKFHPDNLPHLKDFRYELIKADDEGIHHIEKEFRYLDNNGNYRWIHGDYSLIRGADNSPKSIIGSMNDITRQKEAEIALKDDELYLRTIIQATKDGFWVVDADASIIDANNAFCEMTGYSLQELRTKKINDIDAIEDPGTTQERIKRILQNGSETFDTRHRRKDGSVFDVEISIIYLAGKGHFICFTRDITERKQIQAALEHRILALTRPLEKQEQINFKDLFELEAIQRLQDDFAAATGVAAIITHPDGLPITRPSNFCRFCSQVIRVTKKGEQNCFKSDAALGRYNPEGPTIQPCLSAGLRNAGAAIMVGGQHIANWLIGQTRDDVISNEEAIKEYARAIDVDENTAVEAFREVPYMPLEQFEKVARALYTMANQLSTIAFQNIQQARFISDQKKVEEELQRLANLFKIAEWGISIGNAEGKSLDMVNPAYAKMHGYSVEELKGMPIAGLYAPECREGLAEHIRLTHELGHHTWECRHLRKDGSSFPALVDATAVRDDVGQIQYRVVSIQDISERKSIEEALRLSEQKFSTAFHVSPDSINLNRLSDGMYIEINQGFTDLTGYTKEDVRGKTSLELNIWDNTEDRKRLVAGLRENGFVNNLEASFRRKDGSVRTGWMSARVIEIDGEQCILSITRDVNDYKKAREIIEENEARQSIMIGNVSDVMGIVDKNGIIQYESPNITKWFGWLPEDLVGKPCWKAIHPEDREWLQRELSQFLEKENEYKTVEYRAICKDGLYKWVELTAVNLVNNPLINGILVNYHDITERMQMQTAIRENEARFRALFTQNPDGVIILNPENGKIIEFNDAAHRQLGYTREEFARLSVTDLEAKESVDEVVSHIQQVMTRGSSQFETIQRAKNGDLRNVQVIAQVIQLDNKPIYHCIWRDITGEKKAENELRLNAERVQALLRLHQMADRSIQEVTDYAMETAVRLSQSKIGYLAFLNEDETILTMHSWSKQAMDECKIADKPVEYIVKDTGLWGESVRQRKAIITNDYSAANPWKKGYPAGHVSIRRHLSVPVFVDRHIVLVVGVGNKEANYNQTDIDQLTLLMEGMWLILDRMKSETNLKHYRDHLEDLVEERTAELSSINQELEAFSYSVSHDLRAPLRALDGFSNLLKLDYHEKLDEQGAQYIDRIHDAARKMETLITDLLNLSRISSAEYSSKEVNLSRLAENIAREMKEHNKQRSFKIDITPDMIVQGDENLLKIALENLINNAFKFTANVKPARIQIGVQDTGKERVFFIRDNGAGFNMDFAKKLFTPFQRLHLAKDFPGTGIGLSIVKRIIARHGGRIWADAAVGQGATFYFTLAGAKKI